MEITADNCHNAPRKTKNATHRSPFSRPAVDQPIRNFLSRDVDQGAVIMSRICARKCSDIFAVQRD
jgi:hypothetical protein